MERMHFLSIVVFLLKTIIVSKDQVRVQKNHISLGQYFVHYLAANDTSLDNNGLCYSWII